MADSAIRPPRADGPSDGAEHELRVASSMEVVVNERAETEGRP